MAIAEQDIWGKLLTTSSRGFLRWRPDIESRVFCDPGIGTDSRANPERFMVMSGNLHALEEHNPIFTTEDLIETAPNEFTTSEGEITGVNGLLRIVDRFPIDIGTPDKILLAGSISPNSLLSVLSWCRENNWIDTQVTLVDNSPVPIETLSLMEEAGYFKWQGGVELVEGDILRHNPSQPPDIIIADILNAWMVNKYQYPHLDKHSPYLPFENFLRWGAETVGNEGWFLSRCMIFPLHQQHSDPNLRFSRITQKRTEMVMQQLGGLAGNVNRVAIEEGVEQLFDEASRTTFCGLDKVHPLYSSEETLAGPHAEKIMSRLHNRNYQTAHKIIIRDKKSDFTFLNFACQG